MQMNLVPFETISLYIRAMVRGTINPGIAIANLLGNFLLFMPMGVYLPFFFKKIRTLLDYVLYMIPVLTMVELVQLLTKRGSFDIDDLILNLSGAMIGFFIWKSAGVQTIYRKIKNLDFQERFEKEMN
jgi:glycopeptide antibiotics resistance protein